MLLAEERDLRALISGPARGECAHTSGARISHVGGGRGGGEAVTQPQSAGRDVSYEDRAGGFVRLARGYVWVNGGVSGQIG